MVPRTRFGLSLSLKFVLRLSAFLLLFGALPLRTQHLQAQELLTPASELSSYVRLLELQGKAKKTPLVYWSTSTEPRRNGLTVDSNHVWSSRYPLTAQNARPQHPQFRLLDSHADLTFNSAFPQSANDGAVWTGRGITGALRVGAQLRWYGFTARIAPTFGYAQNRDFVLGVGPGNTTAPFAYPWQSNIDFPQRFGNSAQTYADWGQSAIRFDAGAFTAGFSTENLWWGPAYRNAIILGSGAPGFPHLDVGLGKPLHTLAGDVEFRVIWGQLSRSSYAAASTTDGQRILNGLTIGYRPRFLPGLTVGLTRSLYKEWPENPHAGDFFEAFSGIFNNGHRATPDGPVINDQNDQLASLTARWLLPESGAEFYVEYARNDFAGGVTDLVLEPDHARAYTIGFQKTLPVSTGALALRGEHTTLGQTNTRQLREGAPFYIHNLVPEGYTNRGQLLGATIGPGSNSQFLGLDRYTAAGRYGIFAERIRYDDDYAFVALKGIKDAHLYHQLDLTAGVSVLRFSGALDWGAGFGITHQFNRYFVRGNGVTNYTLKFSLGRRG